MMQNAAYERVVEYVDDLLSRSPDADVDVQRLTLLARGSSAPRDDSVADDGQPRHEPQMCDADTALLIYRARFQLYLRTSAHRFRSQATLARLCSRWRAGASLLDIRDDFARNGPVSVAASPYMLARAALEALVSVPRTRVTAVVRLLMSHAHLSKEEHAREHDEDAERAVQARDARQSTEPSRGRVHTHTHTHTHTHAHTHTRPAAPRASGAADPPADAASSDPSFSADPAALCRRVPRRLCADTRVCVETDPHTSTYTDRTRTAAGMGMEARLTRELEARRIPYTCEGALRVLGASKTPDVALVMPVAFRFRVKPYPGQSAPRTAGRGSDPDDAAGDSFAVIHWIDSKALFADLATHVEYRPQFLSYVKRFGPGLVLYTHGHTQEVGDADAHQPLCHLYALREEHTGDAGREVRNTAAHAHAHTRTHTHTDSHSPSRRGCSCVREIYVASVLPEVWMTPDGCVRQTLRHALAKRRRPPSP